MFFVYMCIGIEEARILQELFSFFLIVFFCYSQLRKNFFFRFCIAL
jgi:hypothetical protein